MKYVYNGFDFIMVGDLMVIVETYYNTATGEILYEINDNLLSYGKAKALLYKRIGD